MSLQPTQTHYEIASELLENGIHVFVEKPICSDRATSLALCELAERNGLVLQVGHVERFNPAFVAARHELKGVKHIECTRHTPYTFRATDVSVVLDLMIHDIDLVLSTIQSDVTKVNATATTTIGPHHDSAVAWLEFANGSTACLKASRVSHIADRSMNCIRENGTVIVNFAEQSVQAVCPIDDVAAKVTELSHDEKMTAKEEMFEKWLPVNDLVVTPSNAILEEQKEFVQCINDEHFPTVSGRDGLAAVQVAEAIHEATVCSDDSGKRRSAA